MELPVNEKSRQLYNYMVAKGYPEEFSLLIARELSTDFTARRMMGYLARRDLVPLEEVADEMLAILSDRDRIMDKHKLEHAQSAINELYRNINED